MSQYGTAEVDAFRFYLVTLGRSSATVKNYIQCTTAYLRWCDQAAVDALTATTQTIMSFLGSLASDHARSTVRLYTLSLRVYYDFLLKAKYVSVNPAREVAVSKQVSKPTDIISDGELRSLINSCETAQDRAMLLLLLGGGLRRSELFGIRAEHCNFEAGTIRIFGKGAKWRQVAPGKAAMEALRIALWRRDRLFAQESHDYIWRRVKTLWQRAGNSGRVYPHRFRFTFAVRFVESGGGIDLLQTILGHSSLEMSMFYSRAGREQRALSAQLVHNPADRLVG